MNNRIDLGPLRPLRVAALGVALSCAGCVYVPPHPYYAYPPPPPPTYGAPVANAAPAPMPTPPNCREFQQTITVNGVEQKAYGTTCQQADGTWRITPTP